MKRFLVLLGCFVALPLLGVSERESTLHAQSIAAGFRVGHAGFFYQSLRSYGEWIELEPGFHAWRPLRVRAGWRPYLHGRWTWTDYGWYWVSHEPFGWAVFHYGRWYFDDYYGWIWIPDDVWGPAWVEWRYNDDYLGWAPLPPYASFSIAIGVRFTTRWYAPAHYWCFVPYRHFGSTRINTYVDEGQSRRLIRTTRSAVRYEVDRDRIVNRGVDRDLIERRGNLRISRMEVGETRERREGVVRSGERERIEVYRPSRSEMEMRNETIDARKSERRSSLDLNRVERNRSTESIQRRETPERRQEQREDGVRTRPGQRQQEERQDQAPRTRTIVPETRQESDAPAQRQAIPERREEFRNVQPQRPSIQQSPQRRESPAVRPAPRREAAPPAAPPQRKSGKRGNN